MSAKKSSLSPISILSAISTFADLFIIGAFFYVAFIWWQSDIVPAAIFLGLALIQVGLLSRRIYVSKKVAGEEVKP